MAVMHDFEELFDHGDPQGAKAMQQAFDESWPALSKTVATEALEAARVDFAHCVAANYVRCKRDVGRLKEFAVETYNLHFADKHQHQ